MVPDWHFEWHSQQDQREVFVGNKAMECPRCQAAVAFDGFVVTKAQTSQPAAKRELRVAALWARNQNQSLADYLKTNEGQAYVGFWSQAEIEAADQHAAAQA